MKTYLHRAIKIQQFLHPREFKKVEHNFKIIQLSITIHQLQAESRIEQGIYSHIIPVLIIVPCSHALILLTDEIRKKLDKGNLW